MKLSDLLNSGMCIHASDVSIASILATTGYHLSDRDFRETLIGLLLDLSSDALKIVAELEKAEV